MDCCGHAHVAAHRPPPWRISLAPVGATLAGEVGPRGSTEAARTAENGGAALDVLRQTISVDVHSHGGRTGITAKAPPNGDLARSGTMTRLAP